MDKTRVYAVNAGAINPLMQASREAMRFFFTATGYVAVVHAEDQGEVFWCFDTLKNASAAINLARAKGIQCDENVYCGWKDGGIFEMDRCVAQKGGQPMTQISDSGDRTLFPTGAVRDMHDGKGRMDLLPWAAIIEVSRHCERGARKYGEHNVDRGIPVHSLCDSGMRHIAKYIDGQTDEDHLLAATWNLLWAIQMKIKKPEMVDVPWREEETNA